MELADEHGAEAVKRARGHLLLNDAPDADLGIEPSVRLTTLPFWEILGRIIHSRETETREWGRIAVGSPWAAAPNTTAYWRMAVVGVRSDRDREDEVHFIAIEKLVEAFCIMERAIRPALRKAVLYEDYHIEIGGESMPQLLTRPDDKEQRLMCSECRKRRPAEHRSEPYFFQEYRTPSGEQAKAVEMFELRGDASTLEWRESDAPGRPQWQPFRGGTVHCMGCLNEMKEYRVYDPRTRQPAAL
jgi:hypothetical protein